MGFHQITINLQNLLLMLNSKFYACLMLCCSLSVYVNGQTFKSDVLRFDEFMGFVKTYHPIVKQAELLIDESQAKLMKARGGFDPKMEVDYARKKFKDAVYYDTLDAAFKIPTWYGIELKGAFEDADGVFLNPENTFPDEGLYSAGVSFSIARGFLINERMVALKQAKIYREQAKADRDILVNTVLYEAALGYFNWLQAYNENLIFEDFLYNAQVRFKGVKKYVEVGELPTIDSIEARIVVNDRKLNLENSRLKLMKAKLELSNYLWINDNVPIELEETIIPDVNSALVVDQTLNIDLIITEMFQVDEHPKLKSLSTKYEQFVLNKRLKMNLLLPKIDLQYNFLSETPEVVRSFSASAYKSGLHISFPLFLRKERADLKLAKLKLKDTEYEMISTKVTLQNKIQALKKELASLSVQNSIFEDVLEDYEQMLTAEERKFTLGESSLFLVNSREGKLIDAKLKAIELQNKLLSSKALLFNKLALNPNL